MKEGKTDQENFPVKTLPWDRAFDINFKREKGTSISKCRFKNFGEYKPENRKKLKASTIEK